MHHGGGRRLQKAQEETRAGGPSPSFLLNNSPNSRHSPPGKGKLRIPGTCHSLCSLKHVFYGKGTCTYVETSLQVWHC